TADRSYLSIALEHGRRRKQLELEVVRQLQLPVHPLLVKVLLHQPAVLDRGADLIGYRRHQFEIARRERFTAESVGEVHDATAARTEPRRGIADGNAEKGLAAVLRASAIRGNRECRLVGNEADDA